MKNRGGASNQGNALTYALDLIQQTCSGEIALVIQDSRLIQLERNERIVRTRNLPETTGPERDRTTDPLITGESAIRETSRRHQKT